MANEKPLRLDPGASPRRKSITGCKCLLLAAAILFPIGVILFLANVAHEAIKSSSDPHRALYQNKTIADVKDRSSVVQPLITNEQKFDIAATVWLRSSEGIRHSTPAPIIIMNKNNTDNEEPSNELDVQETALFSGIVFRGVRLTDKNKFATVNYKLPTTIFRDLELTNYDLRGSFMLIPSSPSLLDHVTSFTTWTPSTMQSFSVRSWPFPLGSSDQSDKTLVDKAIESFGISIPLISFHDIQSHCPKYDEMTEDKPGSEKHVSTDGAPASIATAMDEDDKDLDDFTDDSSKKAKNRVGENTKFMIDIPSQKTILYETKGKPILENHPYVVTRTQFRVVDQTQLFNRKAYLNAHKQLRKTSCGQGIFRIKPSKYMCDPEYRVNGHWGTQFKLQTLNKNTGNPQTEWAYAPYLAATKKPHGPKDIQPIPVYREQCKEHVDKIQAGPFIEKESINVTWKITYSGRTPLKHGALEWNDHFFSNKLNTSESEYKQALEQDSAEFYSGVAGYLFEEGMQPRRRAIISVIGFILPCIISILNIRYWYTRTSTASISILGSTLIASSWIAGAVGDIIEFGKENDLSIIGWISWSLYFCVIFSPQYLLMIKVTARIEFGWWGTLWVPTMQIASATHRERASERLESKTPLHSKIALFLSLAFIYYFFTPYKHHIIAPLLPTPSPGDLNVTWFQELAPSILQPMMLTGQLLQLILNQQSKTYAGSHRISTILEGVLMLNQLADFVPVLVGRFQARSALSLGFVLEIIWIPVACWQAFTLPSVPQGSDDEHIE